MSKSGRNRPAHVRTSRPGEGITLDIVMPRAGITAEGSAAISFGVNLGMAPVPDRRYVADICGVIVKKNVVKLLFGQEAVVGNKLRTLLVVQMDMDAAYTFMKNLDEMHPQGLSDYVEARALAADPMHDLKEEPSQTVALSANMSIAAVAGLTSCLDFYSASPFSMMAVPSTQRLSAEPVVRVDMPVSSLFGLYRELKKVVVPVEIR